MITWSISLNFAQAGGGGSEPGEGPETLPQPCKASDASSAAAAIPPSLKSSRRATLGTVIQALMRFSACAAEDALLKGHGEINSLAGPREQSIDRQYPSETG